MKRYFFAVFIVLMLSILSCSKEGGELKKTLLKIGDWTILAEVADTPITKEKGLMNRKSLSPDCGMLFVYSMDQKLSFWMKNTTIPLSIAYIAADGTIKEIYDMEPLSHRTVDSRYSIRYALEVNQGAFEKHGIKVGDKVKNLP